MAATGPQRAAIIDVGSSSAVVLVFARDRDGTLRTLVKDKEPLRLGAGFDDDGNLRPEAVARTVAALCRFGDVVRRHDVEVLAVATEALRRARNGAAVVAAVREASGIALQRIDGDLEAALTFAGIRTGIPQGPVLGLDIGGGSTELMRGRGAAVEATVSLPLGAVSLAQSAGLGAAVGPEALAQAAATVDAALAPHVADFRDAGLAVATSGSAQRIARMIAGSRTGGRVEASAIDGSAISAFDLVEVIATLAALDAEGRRALPGVDPERADLLLAGALILHRLGVALDVSCWRVSLAGLRLGLAAMAFGLVPLPAKLRPPRRAD